MKPKHILIRLFLALGIVVAGCKNNSNRRDTTNTNTVEQAQKLKKPYDFESSIETLVEDVNFGEGPIWDAKNNRLIFSEVSGNKLYQWTEKEGLSMFMEPSFYAGGNVFEDNGNILSCQGGARRIARIHPDKSMEILIDNYKGKKFNSPNDVVVKSDGTIWFTDPDYGLLAAYGEKAKDYRELSAYHIFRFNPTTKEIVSVDNSLSKPNGLVFSKDESKLFVGNSEEGDRKLVVFDVTPENTLTNKNTLAHIDSSTWGIDGLKLGDDGNLYAACGDGVNIFTPKGELLGKIKTDFEVTNLCFGGKTNSDVFMTGHNGLYKTRIQINEN